MIDPLSLAEGDRTPWWEGTLIAALVACVVGRAAGVRRPVSLPGVGRGGDTDISVCVLCRQGKEETLTVRSGEANAVACSRKLALSCRAEGKEDGVTPSLDPCTTLMAGCPTVLLLQILLLLLLSWAKLSTKLSGVVERRLEGEVRRPFHKSGSRRERTVVRLPRPIGRLHGGRVRRGGGTSLRRGGKDRVCILRKRKPHRLHREVE